MGASSSIRSRQTQELAPMGRSYRAVPRIVPSSCMRWSMAAPCSTKAGQIGDAGFPRQLFQRLASAQLAAAQDLDQPIHQRRDFGETDFVLPVAPHQDQGRRFGWSRGLVIGTDMRHRPGVGQGPGGGREHWNARQQIAIGLMRGDFIVVDLQAQLDPFVMRHLRQPGRVVGPGLRAFLQEADELAPDLGEQRRVAAVLRIELACQRAPALLAQGLADDREIAGQQAFDIVEEQFAIDRQAAILDARWRRIDAGIAQVRGQLELLFAQGLRHGRRVARQCPRRAAVRGCVPLPPAAPAWPGN